MLKSLLIVCIAAFIPLKLSAQNENVQPKFKQVLIHIPKAKPKRLSQKNSAFIIDSLKTLVNTYDSLFKNKSLHSKAKDETISELNQKISSQKIISSRLNLQISKYEVLNMQIRKNNFILLVFNSVVSAFLLLMLLRFLLRRRKKNYVPSLKDYPAPTSIIPDPDSFTKQNNMGRYLDQLERISKLRDTGTLTEEEFLKQKHIILENGN